MFELWKEAYDPYLQDLFGIFQNRLKDKIDIDMNNWDSKELYEDFCNFVYSTSSGYVSPYLE